MALGIWVGDWNKKGSKLVASFNPEAYYTFLIPIFEDSLPFRAVRMVDGLAGIAENELR